MLVVQVIVALFELMEEAARLEMVRLSTVTVVVAVLVPFAFVAVNVYVIVEVGFTAVDPTAVDVENDPGVIAMEVMVPVAFQESVLVPAEATTLEEAAKEEMVGGVRDVSFPTA